MRMQRHSATEDVEHTGIDLAPMLDFVLNLLIFFIITAVFVKELGITVSRPSNKQAAQKKESGTILIAIRGDGEIYMGNRQIDVRAVRANVEREHAEKPEAPVVVVTEADSPTGVLVRVLDQARLGGVENVSIAAGN